MRHVRRTASGSTGRRDRGVSSVEYSILVVGIAAALTLVVWVGLRSTATNNFLGFINGFGSMLGGTSSSGGGSGGSGGTGGAGSTLGGSGSGGGSPSPSPSPSATP